MKAGFQYLVNPLIGCNLDVLKEIENNFSVDPAYRVKYRRSRIISLILHEMARLDRIRYRRIREQASEIYPPVFVIGHWRTGTSFLHTLLCQVYPAAYTTTYQAAFPNNLFAFQGFVKFFMKVFMPENRPTDAMKMHPDYPQEEELALGHEKFFSFYYWFYFPKQAEFITDEFMYLDDPDSKRSMEFREYYREYIRRCSLNTRGEVFISKNPVNTSRIAVLMDMFPDARYIYLKRDPYETLESTRTFFRSLINGISLQDYEEHEVDRFVLENYKRMISTYLEKKELIPPANLIEISYEKLIKHPAEVLSEITARLDTGVKADLAKAKDLLDASSDFPLRKYQFSSDFLNEVNNTLGDLIGRQGYKVRKTNFEDQMKT
jgi:hypothetical protein